MLHPSENSYHGRTSTNQEYWHERIRHTSINDLERATEGKTPVILGFCSDTGIARNHGRIGAKNGPDAIRKALGPLSYHLKYYKILDVGNIFEEEDLESAHEVLYASIKKLLTLHYFPIVFGGGHDLAYPHGKAILNYCKEKNETIGIINLDAHLDLRPLNKGVRHSGSPFFQLSEAYRGELHYCCLGVQLAANPISLLTYADKNQVTWLEMEHFQPNNWPEIQELLERFCGDKNKIYLSIDMDGFSSAYAPGVSAPSPLGFEPSLVLKVIDWLTRSKKLVSMDIVEMNPTYDTDGLTAKLAARLIEYTTRNLI